LEGIDMGIIQSILSSEGFALVVWVLLLILVFAILILLLLKMRKDLMADKERKKVMRFAKFLEEEGAENIQQLLNRNSAEMKDIAFDVETMNNRLKRVEGNLIQSIQKVAIIRFDAFRRAGSNLSYSIALLDYNNDGIIITSIYARESGGQTYAKPINNGKSPYTLAEEEEIVLKKAMGQHVEMIGGSFVGGKSIDATPEDAINSGRDEYIYPPRNGIAAMFNEAEEGDVPIEKESAWKIKIKNKNEEKEKREEKKAKEAKVAKEERTEEYESVLDTMELETKNESAVDAGKEYGMGKEFSEDLEFNSLFSEVEEVKKEDHEGELIAAEEAAATARKAEQAEMDRKWEEYKKTYSKENRNAGHKENKKKS
jgi:hypothetical protein